MSTEKYFASGYEEAREKFRTAAGACGAVVGRFDHPGRAPDGGPLTCDTAWHGKPDAEHVLVTISATHGVEGFCGSGAQVGWFGSRLVEELPAGTAYFAIHAINPHGFAWLRRVTEDNVDLNRNFVDFGQPLPVNEGYTALAEAICPPTWDEETIAATGEVLSGYAEAHGAKALQSAVSGGQYSHADGIFYGGSAPTWSNRLLREIFRTSLSRAREVAVVDFHTGLGPRGHGERICVHAPGSPGFARAKAWYAGDFTSPALGTSSSVELTGYNTIGMAESLGEGTALTAIALEYGTLPTEQVKLALRADNWLHAHGDPNSKKGRDIKSQIREAFYQDADDWKELIWERAVETLRQAAAGLGSG